MRQASEAVGVDFSAALKETNDTLGNIQRLLAAHLLLRYPDTAQLEAEAQELRRLVGADAVEINVLTDDQQITLVADPTGVNVRVSIPSEDSLCILTVGIGEALQVEDIDHDRITTGHSVRGKWGSWASVPLYVKQACAGTVCALADTARHWTDDDEARMVETSVRIQELVDEWVWANT